MGELTTQQGDWQTLLNVEWDDLPHSYDRDDELGKHYWDQPHGGFMVVAETTAYFHHPDADPDAEEIPVRLGICVEFIDWEAAVGEPGYLAVAEGVVHPDSLSDESVADVAGTVGREPDRENIGYFDVSQYGYSVKMRDVHSETGWQDAYEGVKGSLALAEMGVGFVLDKRQNRLGTTGWDIVRDATRDVNAHDAAVQRLKEHYEQQEA